MTQALWTPSTPSQMSAFLDAHGHGTYAEAHAASIRDPGAFWTEIWKLGVIGDLHGPALEGADMITARFFPEARLNYAETCLATRGDGPAVIFRPEVGPDVTLTHDDLRALVSRMQQALAALGVTRGDRVAAVVANTPETLAAMLATAALGAVWASCSPDFGVSSILDRFAQIAPKVILASANYTYKGKAHDVTAKAAEVAGQIGAPLCLLGPDWTLPFEAREPAFTRVGFNDPLFIMFSSGTTGLPKCILHGVGGTLLQHVKEHRLHCDIRPGDRLFFYATASWMMWNWTASALASGATLVLYDGSPFFPHAGRLWDMAADLGITHFGTSPRYLETLRAEGFRATQDLSALRMVLSTGAPLPPSAFAYVYEALTPKAQLASISGGTDIISCFLLGNPTLPVFPGLLQSPGLGMDVRIFDETGAETEGPGELVCTTPFPSRPLGFWGDDGSRYAKAYFASFPGAWCQHDQVRREAGGYEVLGRSDATLNPGGVRIGAGEILRAIEGAPIAGAAVAGRDKDQDVEVVLCVIGAEAPGLAEDLKSRIRRACTPRHVPAHVLFVSDLPRTRNGKLSESALRAALNGKRAPNADQLENPACLAEIAALMA